MRILTAADVRTAITMKDAIDAVKTGFIALSAGKATVPLRGVLNEGQNTILTMPAHVAGIPVNAIKIVTIHPQNPQKNLATVNAMVLVTDGETGLPLAMMDGTELTAIRTGAASGVATDLLARADSKILGVIGSGAQAKTQIEAVCAVRTIEEIRIYSRTNAAKLAEAIQQGYDAKIVVTESAHAALIGADVMVAATNSSTPVINVADIAPGVHINGVGSFTRHMQEVATEVVLQAKVVIDQHEGIWEEAGDLIIPRDAGHFSEADVHAEIGEIAAGKAEGRINDDEITFFKSVGNAVQDVVVAHRIVEIAQALGLGTEVAI